MKNYSILTQFALMLTMLLSPFMAWAIAGPQHRASTSTTEEKLL